MQHRAQTSYTVTADFTYIEAALKGRWAPFHALTQELEQFQPRKLEDFQEYRERELARLRGLNPEALDAELLELIDGQISVGLPVSRQIGIQFGDRIMAEYVTVAFLSHALCEAMINAILAIGLSSQGTSELFGLLERADIKDKWLAGPKSFHAAYSLSKGGALFQTLQHLTRQRNALVHYKVGLEVEGVVKLQGSRLQRAPIDEDIEWIRRFFSLPYDLTEHARRALPIFFLLLPDSGCIERYRAHLA